MREPDPPASSPMVKSAPSSAPGASPAQEQFSTLRTLGGIVLAILLYAILADAAVETVLRGSPERWITAGAVAAYAAVTALLWRRTSWATRAVTSTLMLLFLLTLAAWLPDGVTRGIVLARQRTSTVLALVTGLAVLLAGAELAGSRLLPPPVRWAAGFISGYGTAAFLFGIVAGTGYSDLFHGGGLWARLPFWLQGPFVGALALVPAAVLFHIAMGLRGDPTHNSLLRRRGIEVVGLTAAVLMAVAGLRAPASLGLTGMRISIPKPTYQLGPVIFALGESGGQPLGRADRFQEGIKALYASFDFQGLKGEDTVKAVWYRGADRLSEQSVKVSDVYGATPIPKKGRLRFSIKFDEGATAGGYSVEIRVNGLPARAEIVAVEPK